MNDLFVEIAKRLVIQEGSIHDPSYELQTNKLLDDAKSINYKNWDYVEKNLAQQVISGK